MNSENYISFMTVCGFFIGLICAACYIEDPFSFIAFVAFITFVFHLLVHIVVINFIDTKKLGAAALDKIRIDNDINLVCDALTIREGRIEKLRSAVDEEIRLIKEQSKKTSRTKRKYDEAAA